MDLLFSILFIKILEVHPFFVERFINRDYGKLPFVFRGIVCILGI